MISAVEALQEARECQSSGRFVDAIGHCEQILAVEPNHFAALHLCGLAHLENAQAAEAVALLERALLAQPSDLEVRFDLGVALQSSGRYTDAIPHYNQVLAVKPAHANAWSKLAAAHKRLQQWEASAEAYRQALIFSPDPAFIACQLGYVLLEQKKWPEADDAFRQSLTGTPNQPEAHNGLGLALKGARRTTEAVDAFHSALALRPRYLEALFNLGTTLQALERWPAAIETYKRALAIAPHSLDVLSNLGNALASARNFASAEIIHSKVLAQKPNHAPYHNNLGNALLGLDRFADAIACFEHALLLQPGSAEITCNLGNACLAHNRLDEAIAYYDQALALDPHLRRADFCKSLALLLKGKLKEAFPKYELRWILKCNEYDGTPPREFWQGDLPLEGKTIFLCCEQGLGDTLHFVRYVPILQKRGAHIILRVQPPLKQLLSANFPDVQTVTPDEKNLPPFDLYCLMLSLPYVCGTELNNIPAAVPYLKSSPEKAAVWRDRLAGSKRPRIGLVCAGNLTHRNDHHRTIPLAAFKPLAAAARGSLYLLQKELRPADAALLQAGAPEFIDLSPELNNFTDTAAIIANLDLVISVDTSVAHLVGALGKPVWVLVPFAPDWRWMLEREDSPWYPTMRLFRQSAPRDWSGVLTQVTRELRSFRENFQDV
jgi:tetratricopeptide (TPR) repeat protein